MFNQLYKNQKHILYILNLRLLCGFALFIFGAKPGIVSQVSVFAGHNTSICPHDRLHLADLEATITGEVSDGYWFTLGDGVFLPGNTNKVRYSSGTIYIPGVLDKSNGSFTLLLVSDDPDGEGPKVQVTDSVTIQLQNPPALFCPGSLNVTLMDQCSQVITAGMLVHNPQPPVERYNVVLFDHTGKVIADNTLRKQHIGKPIRAVISHDCAHGSSCETILHVSDKSPPKLKCTVDTIDCTDSRSPEFIGYPFTEYEVIEKVNEKKYKVSGIDNCTDAWVEWHDEEYPFQCHADYESIIYRTWTAIDDFGNKKSCIQEIYIRRMMLSDVTMPPHFDGNDEMALQCGDSFPRLSNGYPSPSFTGEPEISPCKDLQSTFTDHFFDKCGSGYKLLRAWLIIDWCTTESRLYNQIIVVEDTSAPTFSCPPSKIIVNDHFSCYATHVSVDLPINIEDCSDYTIMYSLFDSGGNLIEKNDKPYFDHVPVGKNVVIYEIKDVCGNKDTCSTILEVIDAESPNAVCKEFTVIALNVNGFARLYAESLDEGSFDNCQIVKREVVKIDQDACNLNQKGPFIDFCCEEAGKKIRVALIITDIYGNENSCMVIVDVQEKLPPQLIPPSDLTVSCRTEFDYNDLSPFGKIALHPSERNDIIIVDGFNYGITGKDGLVSDNCYVKITESAIKDLECGKGFIIRTFTARDSSGNKTIRTQTITVKDENPFSFDDIIWPVDYEDEICADTFLSPDISGRPEFLNKQCAQLGISYKDKVFHLAEGACTKIVREWSVIDWCQYESSTSEGIWMYDQIIKINNTSPPQFEFACQDTVVCLFDEDCMNTMYAFTIPVTDDCTKVQDLVIKWQYFEHNVTVATISGSGKEIYIETVPGIHKISIEVKDRCGNLAKCSYFITVKDCKKPTPICISSLTTVLMESSQSVDIWAEDFNHKSLDNCTPSSELIFSFSPDTNYTKRSITCEDIPNGISQIIPLQIWVTDQEGNQDYCEARIQVQDNHDICEDAETQVRVSGRVNTRRGNTLDKVSVEMRTNLPEYGGTYFTGQAGHFEFLEIPSALSIELSARKQDSPRTDVSTLDILLIQRHILGQQSFDNIYKYIAADVNSSGTITSADLIGIRRVILGINPQFPNGTPAWKFVNGDVDITSFDLKNLPEKMFLTTDTKDIDDLKFVAIKMGDVDDLGNGRLHDDGHLRNYVPPFAMVQKLDRENSSLVLYTDDSNMNVEGLQLEIVLSGNATLLAVESELPGFSQENYHLADNILRVSWTGDVDIFPGMEVLTLLGLHETVSLGIKNNAIGSEIYEDLIARPIELVTEFVKDELSDMNVTVLENPFRSNAVLKFNDMGSEEVYIKVFTSSGQLISSKYIGTIYDNSNIVLENHHFPYSGMFFINVFSKNMNKTIKVFKLEP